MFASATNYRDSYFKLSYFTQEFDETFKKYQSFENKDIVLVLGATGVGKSTFTNYMAGCKLEKGKKHRGRLIVSPQLGEKEWSKISHGVDSGTRYPEAVPSSKNFYFADCPSFNSNWTVESKVVGTALTQHAIQQSTTIKSIIFLMNCDDLGFLSTNQFYKNFNALEKSIKNFSLYQSSILFVFNRNFSKLEPKHILANLEDFAEAEEKEKYLQRGATKLLKILSSSPKQFLVFDPLEEKQRENIYSLIQECKPIPKTQFLFPKYDKDHLAFEKAIFQRANNIVDLFRKRNQLRKNLLSASEIDIQESSKIDKYLYENFKNSDEGIPYINTICKIANFDSEIIQQFMHFHDQYLIEDYQKNLPESSPTSFCKIM